MPEGDSIFRVAARLRPLVVGLVVRRAECNAPGTNLAGLVGTSLDAIETHGKNLYFRFSSGLVLHSHLRMRGSWRTVSLGPRTKLPVSARATLVFDDLALICRNAPVVRLVSARRAERERATSNLGPDPLKEDFSVDSVVNALRGREAELGVALLDQRVLAGIGNILKSEALFLARLDPFLACAGCTDEELRHAVDTARKLIRTSVARKGDASIHDASVPFRAPVRITRGRADPLLGTRAPSSARATWVYLRKGAPCFVCGAAIGMRSQGNPERSTYFCPVCQKVDAR